MRMFNFWEIFKRAFKTYDIWPQARSYTHTSAQCSPASVGLAQARPNNICRCVNEGIHIYCLMGEKAIWLDIARVCGRIFTSRRRVKIQHKSTIDLLYATLI